MTTFHEDIAAYRVSLSSFTVEMADAVTHALHWIAWRSDSQTTHGIILTNIIELASDWKSDVGNSDRSKEGTKHIDWQAKQPSLVACVSEGFSLRRCLQAESQGHQNIVHQEERNVEREEAVNNPP